MVWTTSLKPSWGKPRRLKPAAWTNHRSFKGLFFWTCRCFLQAHPMPSSLNEDVTLPNLLNPAAKEVGGHVTSCSYLSDSPSIMNHHEPLLTVINFGSCSSVQFDSIGQSRACHFNCTHLLMWFSKCQGPQRKHLQWIIVEHCWRSPRLGFVHKQYKWLCQVCSEVYFSIPFMDTPIDFRLIVELFCFSRSSGGLLQDGQAYWIFAPCTATQTMLQYQHCLLQAMH